MQETRFLVQAIAAGDVVAAGCCPVPAAAAVVQLLMFLDGVQDVMVDEVTGTIVVTHDPGLAAAGDMADELAAVGLPAEFLSV